MLKTALRKGRFFRLLTPQNIGRDNGKVPGTSFNQPTSRAGLNLRESAYFTRWQLKERAISHVRSDFAGGAVRSRRNLSAFNRVRAAFVACDNWCPL